jgi:hypothetical protein
MSEFEAYNTETNEWDVFPISRLGKIRNNRKYSGIVVNPDAL